jgi:hypothetical protein
MAEILATSMGGTVQCCITNDYRVMKLLLPVKGSAVYNHVNQNGQLEQNLTDSLLKL